MLVGATGRSAAVALIVVAILWLWFRWRQTTRPPPPPPEGYRVTPTSHGRDGSVDYEDAHGTVRFDWEYGGRDVILFVMVPTPADWPTRVPWAAERRAEILDRVAREVFRQQCRGCDWTITDRWIEFRESRVRI